MTLEIGGINITDDVALYSAHAFMGVFAAVMHHRNPVWIAQRFGYVASTEFQKALGLAQLVIGLAPLIFLDEASNNDEICRRVSLIGLVWHTARFALLYQEGLVNFSRPIRDHFPEAWFCHLLMAICFNTHIFENKMEVLSEGKLNLYVIGLLCIGSLMLVSLLTKMDVMHDAAGRVKSSSSSASKKRGKSR